MSNNPDMIFVLDGSGSVGRGNFLSILNFVKDVVKGFKIGPDETRVGVIKYSTSVTREFDLKDYSTKNDVLSAIDQIIYSGGGTNTHLALDEMTNHAFSVANGARPHKEARPRIGIILTDGKSNNPPLTVMSALRAHDADITMLAIGRVRTKTWGIHSHNWRNHILFKVY